MKKLSFPISLFMLGIINSAWSTNLSPYGTGFLPGSKEDLEIRFEWAKRDPCFNHGFAENSLQILELKKYWMIKKGPNASIPKCNIKKE